VPVQPRKPKQPEAQTRGVFASLFGGAKKTKQAASKPVRAVEQLPPKPNAPKGAYIYGGCGCGKTVLLDLFFRSLPEGLPARRLHWHEFIRDAFRSMHGQPSGENVFAAMADKMAKQFRVLLLDELLITHISEAILVKNLFRHMWARGMTVITTSNYLPEELYANGFNRDQFADFIPDLMAQCQVINMGGNATDYRKIDVASDENIFFQPLDASSTASFNEAFQRMVASGGVEKDALLPIPEEKRAIRVPMQGRDERGASVAKFSFHDLCAQNLGRSDYNIIAGRYHTVFLEGVPKFKPDLGTEFQRFVTLTETLYGKKVVLYMQSEVHSDLLFEDDRLDAEMDFNELWAFRRCSSRLSEMRNPKYRHMVWLLRNHMLQESATHL
jgi:cell division protein ZapE